MCSMTEETCNTKANEEVEHGNGSSYKARHQEQPDKEAPHTKAAPKLRLHVSPGEVIEWVISSSKKVLGNIAISEHLILTGMTASRPHPSVQNSCITSNTEQVKQGCVDSWARYLKDLRQHIPVKHQWAMKSQWYDDVARAVISLHDTIKELCPESHMKTAKAKEVCHAAATGNGADNKDGAAQMGGTPRS